VIVDDMISTGATIEAAARVLLAHRAKDGMAVAATHGLLVGSGPERLAAAPIGKLLVTDSVRPVEVRGLPVEVLSIAGLLADAIGRLHRNEDLADLLMRA
jgi:ribose-phosphate pyrophosphokinase